MVYENKSRDFKVCHNQKNSLPQLLLCLILYYLTVVDFNT